MSVCPNLFPQNSNRLLDPQPGIVAGEYREVTVVWFVLWSVLYCMYAESGAGGLPSSQTEGQGNAWASNPGFLGFLRTPAAVHTGGTLAVSGPSLLAKEPS